MVNDFHSRQRFLGHDLERTTRECVVGIVGLGGGGSHIAQQIAHVGFQNFVAIDPDRVEFSNLNRLIGGAESDAFWSIEKVHVAGRMIQRIQGRAIYRGFMNKWQEQVPDLIGCDLIFGCLDSLIDRENLERVTRAYLIPYIDIGMSVRKLPHEPPRMHGQVFLSMPGERCMRCVGLVDDGAISSEAEQYGDAGPNPQVVWANGVLASTAVGLGIETLIGWSSETTVCPYLSFDGNKGTITPHPRWLHGQHRGCPHFPPASVGPPAFHRL
jgi:molybdopterin-synthase adenylyltransferase